MSSNSLPLNWLLYTSLQTQRAISLQLTTLENFIPAQTVLNFLLNWKSTVHNKWASYKKVPKITAILVPK